VTFFFFRFVSHFSNYDCTPYTVYSSDVSIFIILTVNDVQ